MSTIDHDYGDDSRCRVCNAYGPNEDHIPCTANTTAPTTDRAAIEALARELTDDDWCRVFCTTAGFVREAFATDLLAYLDEVWRGLTEKRRGHLRSIQDCESVPWRRRRGMNESMLGDKLIDYLVGAVGMRWAILAPLGRAVLRRAKEQGR